MRQYSMDDKGAEHIVRLSEDTLSRVKRQLRDKKYHVQFPYKK